MEEQQIEADLKKAAMAVRHARDVRSFHARKGNKGEAQREEDLRQGLDRLARSMKPLRSYLGRAPYQPMSHNKEELLERVREASSNLQAERRRLWKMQVRKKKKKK